MQDSQDAEAALLGALILDNKIYADIKSIVIAADFNFVKNRQLFVQIEALLLNGSLADAIILSQNGDLYAFELIRGTFVSAHAFEYAKIVRKASLLRQLIGTTSKFNALSNIKEASPEHIIHELTSELAIMRDRLGLETNEWLKDAQLFLEKPVPPKWLIKNWLPQNALGMIHAKPGVGKSFLVLDWALHICCGLAAWFDCPVTPGGVVYLAGEGHMGLSKRLKAWAQYHNQSSFNLTISASSCLLDTSDGLHHAINSIKQLTSKPVLIIIDTLNHFSSGQINEWKDGNRIMGACSTLRNEFNSTILLLHHTGHSETAKMRGMGTMALNIPLDVNINLNKEEDGSIAMECVKMRDYEKPGKLLIDLKSILIDDWIDDQSNKMQSAVVVLASSQKEINYFGAKMKNAQKLFEEVWIWSNYKLTNADLPYINRTEIEEYLLNVKKMNQNHAQKISSFTSERSQFAFLLNTKMLEIYGDGCAILNHEWAKNVLDLPVVKK